MKKIICFITLIAALLGLLCFSAYGQEPDEGTLAEDSANTEGTEDSGAPAGGNNITASEGNASTAPEGTDGTKGESEAAEGNGFAELYTLIGEHIGEVFAFLACAFSGILMLCYKKGILPLIKGGLTALSGGVSALSEEAKRQSEGSAEASVILAEGLARAQDVLEKMSGSLSTMEQRLSHAEAIGKENELIRTVLTEEVNMLYEVFMAATLPEYQKERISRAVNEMRERLSASGEGDEEA